MASARIAKSYVRTHIYKLNKLADTIDSGILTFVFRSISARWLLRFGSLDGSLRHSSR
jgi:hypothetical protein